MSGKIIKATLAAILASGIATVSPAALADTSKMQIPAKAPKGLEKCYGITKAGMNDCGTATNNGCAGSAKTDSDKSSWIFLPTGTCKKIVGGSTEG